jgi:hypothetical protein
LVAEAGNVARKIVVSKQTRVRSLNVNIQPPIKGQGDTVVSKVGVDLVWLVAVRLRALSL